MCIEGERMRKGKEIQTKEGDRLEERSKDRYENNTIRFVQVNLMQFLDGGSLSMI